MSESVNRLDELASDRLRICELEEALKTYEVEKQNLQEENKGLRLTLALRTDCEHELERVRSETHPGVEELERKLANAEKEISVMESTNKELLATLNLTRGQLGKMLRERNEKIREVEQLEEALEKMEMAQKSIKRDHLTYDYDMNNYNSNMKILLDELSDQSARYETEKKQMVKTYEEAETKLKKENEKLKAQKEDIVNHSRNSEKMWTERFEQISADLARLQTIQKSLGIRSDEALFAEHEAKTYELSRKLKDALDAIEEVEDENGDLREKLVEANGRITELETEYSFQKHAFETEQESLLEDAREHEDQIAQLNEQLSELEAIRDALRRDVIAVTERQTQQTIAFSNEKAKFCHDMERMEEKWSNEVETLQKKYEELQKESDEKKNEFLETGMKMEYLQNMMKVQTTTSEEEISTLKKEIKELEVKLQTAKSEKATSVKEWDSECNDLEDEIYSLINKRKTETKKLRTMTRKNEWLTKSLRKLSEQRREDLEVKMVEIRKLRSLSQLHEEEKKSWIESLKSKAQDWEDEASMREEVEQQVEKLQQQNLELEEKIENVTNNWRRECQVYEDNMASIQNARYLERERTKKKLDDFEETESRMFARIETLTSANVKLEKALETQAAEASDNQKSTIALHRMEMNNLCALWNGEKKKAVSEKTLIIQTLEKRVKVLEERSDEDEQMLIECNVSIDRMKKETQALKESHEMETATLKTKIHELKKTNQKLSENMGVAELKDGSSEDSDCSDDSDCSQDSDCSDSDEDEEVARDEIVTEKEPQEWELVEEDDE